VCVCSQYLIDIARRIVQLKKDFQAGNCNHEDIVACFFSLKYPSAIPHRDVPTANIH